MWPSRQENVSYILNIYMPCLRIWSLNSKAKKKNLIIFVIYSIQSVASLEGNYCLKVMFWLWFNLNLRFYFSSWSSQAQPFRFLSLSLRQTQLQYILWAGLLGEPYVGPQTTLWILCFILGKSVYCSSLSLSLSLSRAPHPRMSVCVRMTLVIKEEEGMNLRENGGVGSAVESENNWKWFKYSNNECTSQNINCKQILFCCGNSDLDNSD